MFTVKFPQPLPLKAYETMHAASLKSNKAYRSQVNFMRALQFAAGGLLLLSVVLSMEADDVAVLPLYLYSHFFRILLGGLLLWGGFTYNKRISKRLMKTNGPAEPTEIFFDDASFTINRKQIRTCVEYAGVEEIILMNGFYVFRMKVPLYAMLPAAYVTDLTPSEFETFLAEKTGSPVKHVG